MIDGGWLFFFAAFVPVVVGNVEAGSTCEVEGKWKSRSDRRNVAITLLQQRGVDVTDWIIGL